MAELIRVGHKGADAVVPGNTIESFRKAVEIGVDIVELDVLWLDRAGPAEAAGDERSPLVVAHDREAADAGERLVLDDALAAFTAPPLDRVEIDLDLKLPGREEEIVDSVRRHGLLDRSMVSTMETGTLRRIAGLEPGLRRGWTVPRVSRDWSANRYLRPVLALAIGMMRRRLPGIARARFAELGVEYTWVYERLVSAELLEVAGRAGVKVMAWTVDSRRRIEELERLGVDGIVSNDPGLLARAERPASGG